MRAVVVDRFGEPDVLVVGEADDPEPGPGQLVVEVRLAGVAFGDVMVRSGRYPLPLPWIPGLEVAGQVVAAGPDAGESLLVQTAKAAGATVIGAASREKLAAVKEFGADHAIDYGAAGWPDQVRELTGGRGATLVLDAVGGATTASALAAAADGTGRVGLYGYASGTWPTLDIQAVTRRGLTLSGPLGMVIRESDARQRDDAEQALAAAARGELTPRIHARFPLDRAADAHRELEARRSVGAIVLTS